MNEDRNCLDNLQEGLSALHPARKQVPVLIAPSIAKEFNTIRAFLVPTACFRREDNSFDFNSSFAVDFDPCPLKKLLAAYPGSKLSIFGHTDPVGQDNFNKVLSGRRALSVFGLLLRDVSLWDDLYRHHDAQSKDKWGVKAVQIMLNSITFPTGRADGELDQATEKQLKKFEVERGLPATGFDAKQEIASYTFKQLAAEYMDRICIDDDLKPFKLTQADFLARGKGKDGKGDIQGCGEFNPVVLFSKADNVRLNKTNEVPRNEKNQCNRRVMILLFRAGSEIDPNRWPCPTVKEDGTGCEARFFSDAENRRQNTDQEREFAKTKDTFACRFYHRLVESSPCERVFTITNIRLYDGLGRFIPFAPFTSSIEENPSKETIRRADGQGVITLLDIPIPSELTIRWGFPAATDEEPELWFRRTIFLVPDSDHSADATRKRLKNLGFVGFHDEENNAAFQLDYGLLVDPPLEVTGQLDNRTRELVDQVHRQSADDLQNSMRR